MQPLQWRQIRRAVFVVLAWFTIASGAGCNRQNGIRVHEDRWDNAVRVLSAQAEIDLNCGDLEYKLIERTGKEPTKIAVEGCGHRALYQRSVRRGALKHSHGSDWALVTRS